LREHAWTKGTRHEKWGHEIDLEDAPEFLRRRVLRGGDAADAGVVHQDIHTSPARENGLRKTRDHGFIRDIADEIDRVNAVRTRGGDRFGWRPYVVECQRVASRRQHFRDPPTDSLCGASDDRDAHVHPFVACRPRWILLP
jgi:hypothetical protein